MWNVWMSFQMLFDTFVFLMAGRLLYFSASGDLTVVQFGASRSSGLNLETAWNFTEQSEHIALAFWNVFFLCMLLPSLPAFDPFLLIVSCVSPVSCFTHLWLVCWSSPFVEFYFCVSVCIWGPPLLLKPWQFLHLAEEKNKKQKTKNKQKRLYVETVPPLHPLSKRRQRPIYVLGVMLHPLSIY